MTGNEADPPKPVHPRPCDVARRAGRRRTAEARAARYTIVGDKLRQVLQERHAGGLSDNAVAESAGMHPNIVHRFRTGRRASLDLESLNKICTVLGLDLVVRPGGLGERLPANRRRTEGAAGGEPS